MEILSGTLDRRIRIQRGAKTNTGSGVKTTWSDIGTVWGSRSDASDGEKIAAGTIEGTVLSRFVVRSSSFTRDIKPSDRLICEGLTYNITGIKQKGRRDYLEITATAGLD